MTLVTFYLQSTHIKIHQSIWQFQILSTLCLKINYSLSGGTVFREEKHFICWFGLLFWHPWKLTASFLGIVSTSFTPRWRPANLQPRSQQMALRSYICSRSCFGKSLTVWKSIVQELELKPSQNGTSACNSFQVTCNLVTHNSGANGFCSSLLKISLPLCFL